jgi:hypothetical protein
MSSAADYYGGSGIPPTTSYGPPKIDFSPLANGLESYVQGKQLGRQEDQAEAFRNGIPRDPKDPTGNSFDINKTVDIMARHDPSLAMPLLQMQLGNQYGEKDAAASRAVSASVHGGGVAQGQPQPQGQPQGQPQVQPARGPTPQGAPVTQASEGQDTIRSLATEWSGGQDAMPAIGSAARTLRIHPDAPLTPEQAVKVKSFFSNAAQPGANAQQAPQAPPPNFNERFDPRSPGVPSNAPADTDPENSARLEAAKLANQGADELQARQIAAARNNPKAAEGMQKQIDALRAEANKQIDAVNADVARTNAQKDSEASGHGGNPERAVVRAEELKDEVARSSKTYAGIQGQARQYESDMKPTLTVTRTLLSDPRMNTGFGSGAALQVNRVRAFLGDKDAAVLQEALTKITAVSVLSQINTQKDQMAEVGGAAGRIFKSQAEKVEQAAPSMGNTVAGNRFLVNVSDRMGQFSTEIASQAQDYINAHGHLDANFDRQISNYLKAHPVFTPKDTAATLSAPDAPPNIVSEENGRAWIKAMGLKVGDPFRLPDGKITYVKPYKGPNLGPLQPGSAAAK